MSQPSFTLFPERGDESDTMVRLPSGGYVKVELDPDFFDRLKVTLSGESELLDCMIGAPQFSDYATIKVVDLQNVVTCYKPISTNNLALFVQLHKPANDIAREQIAALKKLLGFC